MEPTQLAQFAWVLSTPGQNWAASREVLGSIFGNYLSDVQQIGEKQKTTLRPWLVKPRAHAPKWHLPRAELWP